jgi:hypothetical protein
MPAVQCVTLQSDIKGKGEMFSLKQKQFIAAEIEKLLLSLSHPEMPTERPKFKLHVDGKEEWSFADIEPNWTYEDNPPQVNPFNEFMAKQKSLDFDIEKLEENKNEKESVLVDGGCKCGGCDFGKK